MVVMTEEELTPSTNRNESAKGAEMTIIMRIDTDEVDA
jgi:hypothetical protein